MKIGLKQLRTCVFCLHGVEDMNASNLQILFVLNKNAKLDDLWHQPKKKSKAKSVQRRKEKSKAKYSVFIN